MTLTPEKAGRFTTDESDHTQDEALRGFDFHAPVRSLGDKALKQVLPKPTIEVSPEERAAPHEFNGFAD